MAGTKIVKNPKIRYSIDVDVKPLVAGVRVAKKEMDQLRGKTTKQTRATKKATRETRDFKKAWDGVKKLGAGSGTFLGTLTADLGDLGEGLVEIGGATGLVLGAGAAVTAVGVAAAAAVVGAVKLFGAWRSLTLEAAELAEGMHSVEGRRMAAELAEAKIASDELQRSMDVLKVTLAADLSPAFIDLTRHLTNVAVGLSMVSATWADMRAMGDVAEELREELGRLARTDEILARIGEKKSAAMRRELAVGRLIEQHLRDVRDARARAARAAEEQRKATEALREEMEAINAVGFRPFGDIVEEEIKFKDATKQIVNHTSEGIAEMDALIADHDASRQAAMDAEVLAAAAASKMKGEIALRGASDLVGLAAMVTDAYMDGLDMETEAGRRAAREAFEIRKVANIAQIVIDTAAGIVRAFAEYGWPWGAIPAGIIGTTGTAQAAIVAAQSPSFPVGGVIPPDHRMISAMAGEAILNRRATEALGADGVARLNEGRAGGAPIVVVQQYRHRVYDAFVADNMQSGGPLSRRFDRLARVGHSGRR